jgi:hypothetical protein
VYQRFWFLFAGAACRCIARGKVLQSPIYSFVQDLGRQMARKHRFRFSFPDVFAGRPLVLQGRCWLIANSLAAVA